MGFIVLKTKKQNNINSEWEAWKTKFEAKYSSVDEEAHRFQVFANNLKVWLFVCVCV